MKPSEVRVELPFPFTDTFQRNEYEAAAAFIVETCRHHGDEFGFVTREQMQATLKEVAQREPWASWVTNPFVRPDFNGLVLQGFAEWDTENGGHAIRLTDAALALLREHWVKSPKS